MYGSSFDGVTVPWTEQNVVPVMSTVKVFEDWTAFFVVNLTTVAFVFTKKFSSIPTAYAMYSVSAVRSSKIMDALPTEPRLVTISSKVLPMVT